MFYKKNLQNIDALNTEKRILKNELAVLNKNNNTAKATSKKDKQISNHYIANKLLNTAFGNSNIATIAMQVIPVLLPNLNKKIVVVGTKKILFKVSKELATGYLKWKSIEVIYKILLKYTK